MLNKHARVADFLMSSSPSVCHTFQYCNPKCITYNIFGMGGKYKNTIFVQSAFTKHTGWKHTIINEVPPNISKNYLQPTIITHICKYIYFWTFFKALARIFIVNLREQIWTNMQPGAAAIYVNELTINQTWTMDSNLLSKPIYVNIVYKTTRGYMRVTPCLRADIYVWTTGKDR